MSRLARVRPTRRGKAVVGVVAVALALAATSGTRTLDIVYAAGATLLCLTAVGVARLDEPATNRNAPEYGSVGDSRTVEVSVDAGRPVAVRVADGVGDGLDADARFETAADGDALAYEVGFRERGKHALGPLRATVTDAFGLWRRAFVAEETDEITVYPRVRPLAGTGLLAAYRDRDGARTRFDTIRPYERGDPLRDVNWKASAKQPDDLVVTEYDGDSTNGTVTVAVAAGRNASADAAAEAAASVAVHLLDGGLAVGLTTAETSIRPSAGERHRRRLLGALATFEPGRLEDGTRAAADVVVDTPPGARSARVAVGDERHRFGDLVGRDGGDAAETRATESGRERARAEP